MVNLDSAVAYHLCLKLTATFPQLPTSHKGVPSAYLMKVCTLQYKQKTRNKEYTKAGKGSLGNNDCMRLKD